MRIFVDADACPKAIKEILFRASMHTKIELVLVSNHFFQVPMSPFIKTVKVAQGFDEADKFIADAVCRGDLIITADIPLASIVVNKGCIALNPRGRLYTADNIKSQLATRDLMAHLRDNQMISGGVGALNKSDRQAFAKELDKILGSK